MINRFNKGEVLKADRLNEVVSKVNYSEANWYPVRPMEPLDSDFTSPFQMLSYDVDPDNENMFRIRIAEGFLSHVWTQGGKFSLVHALGLYPKYYNEIDNKYYPIANTFYDADSEFYVDGIKGQVAFPVNATEDDTDHYVINRYTADIHKLSRLFANDLAETVDQGCFTDIFQISRDQDASPLSLEFTPFLESSLYAAEPFRPLIEGYVDIGDWTVAPEVVVWVNGGNLIKDGKVHALSGIRNQYTWGGGDMDLCIIASEEGIQVVEDTLWSPISAESGYFPLYDIRVRWIGGVERVVLVDRHLGEQNIYVNTPTPPPFWINVKEIPDDGWYITVEPGIVRQQNIFIEEATTINIPLFNGVALDADPKPQLEWDGTKNHIYVHVPTDNRGTINGTVEIKAETTPMSSEHHVPPDPDDSVGVEGSYYFKIGELESLDGGQTPSVKVRYPGNLNLPNQLIEVENVGSGATLYKGYDEVSDIHAIKSLVGRYTNPAMQISEVGATEVRIEGNGFDGTLLFTDCNDDNLAKIEVTDGLTKLFNWTGSVWEEGDVTLVIPNCSGTSTTAPPPP